MEQTITRASKRAGWSERESNLLWETADEAQQQGLPLKAVFDRIAAQTGRRPNSIRNYYYAQVRQREGGCERPARFVPFSEEEVRWLLDKVLRDRAQGHSVRSCLQRLADGDHSLMLRYQNKYRAVIKNRPELVREIVDALNAEGIACEPPEVNHRTRASLGDACERLSANVAWSGDAELVRAIDTLAQFLQGLRPSCDSALCQTANELICVIKDYLARPLAEQENGVAEFCDALRERIGALEACLPVSE
ncbi:MAG TPA: hypothetical protein IAA64_12165 [Candidatus Ornithocaccomicrobium faecavium]|uniref:Myb-like domain-containing protein n=1 Tax=Candidatus Ornithocaccomicrobium faecavium TaxID=2840890 RepID=A0A9D1TDZ7_9FIRM|nr:hypothetical protein [Clostridiales bacterium]HIV28723.1 hypothetical protein [Candidatus Ornithocaccomicrobium faecavium]